MQHQLGSHKTRDKQCKSMRPAKFNRKQAVLFLFWVREQLAGAATITSESPCTHLLICKQGKWSRKLIPCHVGFGINQLYMA